MGVTNAADNGELSGLFVGLVNAHFFLSGTLCLILYCVKVNQSRYRPEVARGFQEVKVPKLRDNGPGCW